MSAIFTILFQGITLGVGFAIGMWICKKFRGEK